MSTTFIFCGVNEGYQGDLVGITDPKIALEIVKQKLEERKDNISYEIYPGKVVYQKNYGCPTGGEVIAAIISSGDPNIIRQTGSYLQDALLQTSLSIATYEGGSDGAKHLTRGFKAIIQGCSMDKVALEWHNQAEDLMSSTMYVTAGFYTRENEETVFIQAEANPEKSHLNSPEKIQQWEEMAKLVAQKTAVALGTEIQLEFHNVYFNYLRKEKSSLISTINQQERKTPRLTL